MFFQQNSKRLTIITYNLFLSIGGPIGVFANESNLADNCWHHVEVRRKKARLTVIIDKEKYGKIRQESSPTHIKLNLNNKTSNVIYYGGALLRNCGLHKLNLCLLRVFLNSFTLKKSM